MIRDLPPVARLPDHVAQLHREVARARETGVDLDFISPAEAQRLTPFLEDRGILAMIYSPTDLYLEPVQIPLGYARAAQRLGAEIIEQTAVTAITTRDGAITGVVTDQGEIRTPVVVDAGGAWTRVVGPASTFETRPRPTIASQMGLRTLAEGMVPSVIVTLPVARRRDNQSDVALLLNTVSASSRANVRSLPPMSSIIATPEGP